MIYVYWFSVGLLTLPLALLALTSLTPSDIVGFPLGSPTLHWYREALADPAARRAFGLSVALAGASALLSVIVGTWIALTASLLRRRWVRLLLLGSALSPIVIPGLVHAIALRIAVRIVGLDPGPIAILLGHVIHSTPYAVIMVTARRATLPGGLMEAARDLGASPLRALIEVVLPWLMPALIGAGTLAAITSFDDFIRSFFLGGYDPTLPVLIFGRLRSGLTPEINAIATLTLLLAYGLGTMIDRLAQHARSELPAYDPGAVQVQSVYWTGDLSHSVKLRHSRTG